MIINEAFKNKTVVITGGIGTVQKLFNIRRKHSIISINNSLLDGA